MKVGMIEIGRWSRMIPDSSHAMLSNAVSIAASTGATSGLGFVYWIVAARCFTAHTVGLGSAAVSAMTLVSTLASLGMTTYVLGEAHHDRERAVALVVAAIIVATALAALGGIAYLLVGRFVTDALRPLSQTPWSAVMFAAGCLLLAGTNVLDSALVGALQGSWQLLRNTLFGVLKLLLVVAFAVTSLTSLSTLLLTWVLGMLGSLIVVAHLVRPRARAVRQSLRIRQLGRNVKNVSRAVRKHQFVNLALKAPILVLPALIVTVLSPEDNAHFYIAWMVANLAFVLPGALSSMLYVMGARDLQTLPYRMQYTFVLSLVISVFTALLVVVSAKPLLLAFGHDYATGARPSLFLLTASGVPLIVKNHYLSVRRAQDRLGRALPIVWCGAVLEVTLALVGARLAGLTGVSLGWVCAVTIEAAAMAPTLLSTWRERRYAPPRPAS